MYFIIIEELFKSVSCIRKLTVTGWEIVLEVKFCMTLSFCQSAILCKFYYLNFKLHSFKNNHKKMRSTLYTSV